MIFVSNISQLQYYNTPPGGICYCEALVRPSDVTLQAPLDFNGNGTYTMLIEVWSPNGLTNLETSTSYFDYYFFVNPITLRHSFNIQLKAFTPAMCIHKCFLIRVTVYNGSTTYFSRFTERYCQSTCCVVPQITSITQEAISQDVGIGSIDEPVPPPAPGLVQCDPDYLALHTWYECYDKQTGEYYATPGDILSGDASFTFGKTTNLLAILQQVPREITREYSFNCILQRTESQRQYEVRGRELFPPWKMNEIENQLHSPNIYIDDVQYQFNGGTLFEQFVIPRYCYYQYKLKMTLNDCNIFQIHGCGDACNTNGATLSFMVVTGAEQYYSENRNLVATDADELMNYYRNLSGVTDVVALDPGDFDCDFDFGFTVYSTSAYVPNSIFIGQPQPNTRLFGLSDEELAAICVSIIADETPDLGTPVITDDTSTPPVFGTPTITDYDELAIAIYPAQSWQVQDSSAVVSQGVMTATFNLRNPDYPLVGSPATVPIIADLIARFDINGAPKYSISITPDDNTQIPADTTMTIDENGYVRYYGTLTSADMTYGYIQITFTYLTYK